MRRLIKRVLLSNVVSFSQTLFNSFKTRVLGNSGVVEAESCAFTTLSNLEADSYAFTTLSNLDARNLLQSATFVLAPSGYKSGVIYSQAPSNGNGDLTVTRATSATRVNSSGVIETVASGVPQLDYSLGGCPNFLFEPQRQNMALNSDVGATQSITVVSGRVYTLSFYGTGSITYSGAASGTLNGTGANNRVSVTITASTTLITLIVTGSVLFLQFEGTGGANPANYPTSYIPTTSTAVTRNATSFTRSNIYTNGLIGASGGTWFLELKNNVSLTRDVAGTSLFIGDTSGGTTNSLFLRNDAAGTRLSILKRVGSSATWLYVITTDSPKIIINWNGSVCNIFVNGVKQVSSNSFTTLSMEYMNLNPVDVPYYISQMALWNTPLSDAQCIALTS